MIQLLICISPNFITTFLLDSKGREPDWATKLSEDPKQTAQGDALKNPNNKTNQSPNAQPVKLHDNQNNSDDEYSTRTPHQNMNVVVYFLLLSLAAFILDRLYGGLISVWLRVYFPREASLLGFKPAK